MHNTAILSDFDFDLIYAAHTLYMNHASGTSERYIEKIMKTLHQSNTSRHIQWLESKVDVGTLLAYKYITWSQTLFLDGKTKCCVQNAIRNYANNYRWQGIPYSKKNLLIFQQSKRRLLLYSMWCHSLALLTHPETCWMQPPLFAVLPSSTAPRTVAKQPT